MALTSGTKLGPFEIQSSLGAGGMGEVYRADMPARAELSLLPVPATRPGPYPWTMQESFHG